MKMKVQKMINRNKKIMANRELVPIDIGFSKYKVLDRNKIFIISQGYALPLVR